MAELIGYTVVFSLVVLMGLGFARLVRGYFQGMNKSFNTNEVPSSGWGCPTCLSEYNTEVELCHDCKTKLIDFSTMPNWTTTKK